MSPLVNLGKFAPRENNPLYGNKAHIDKYVCICKHVAFNNHVHAHIATAHHK